MPKPGAFLAEVPGGLDRALQRDRAIVEEAVRHELLEQIGEQHDRDGGREDRSAARARRARASW